MYNQSNKNQEKNQDFQSENGNRLRDINQFGKIQPWKEKKMNNAYYADVLELLEFKKAYNVRECGQYLEFAVGEDGIKRLKQAFFCKSKLCPLCNWRRSKKLRYQVMEIVQACITKEPKGRWLFLTLTCRNVATKEELDETMREMTKALNRLFKYKKVAKNVLGFLRGTEVTVNHKESTYHPHFHVLLFVQSSYFTGNQDNYINQEEWTKLWQKAMKLDYKPIVDIRAVRPNKRKGTSDTLSAVLETAKYPVKESDYLTGIIWQDNGVIFDLEYALYKKRLLGFGGLLKTYKWLLFASEDMEDGDLIKIGDEDKISETVKTVLYYWDSFRRDYYQKLFY